MRSAVILPVELPSELAAIRNRHVPVAAAGVPAHVTLLFPFLQAEQLDEPVRQRLAAVVARTSRFAYRLDRIERWPDAVWVAPGDPRPFEDLEARLAGDWPHWPLHGGGVAFVPHVTVAITKDDRIDAAVRRVAARVLPVDRAADHVEVICEAGDGRWQTRWSLQMSR